MNKFTIAGLAVAGFLATAATTAFITIQLTGGLEPKKPALNVSDLNESTDITIDGRQDYTIEVDGVEREFIVYRPKSLADDVETPVVFMFHGSGGDGEKMYETTGWKEKADEEGLTIVYPTALKFHVFSEEKVVQGELKYDVAVYQTKWNEFKLEELLDPEYPNQTLKDDIHFTQTMVDFMKENYPVDENHFYSTGFSNGANFSARTCVQMHDVFAACAVAGAGRVTPEDAIRTNEYTDANFIARPIFVTIGEKDAKISNALGVEAVALDESIANDEDLIKKGIINPYLDLLGLEDTYDYTKTERLSRLRYHTTIAGEGEQEFNIMIVKGAGHIYPNGTNYPLDITDAYWPFFEQFSL